MKEFLNIEEEIIYQKLAPNQHQHEDLSSELLDAANYLGSSGMLELGCHLRPSAESRWLIDLGLNGWSGKQQGVTAQAGVQLAF